MLKEKKSRVMPRRGFRETGFTLVEVAISLGIVAIGVLTLALFLPIALKGYQQARFQLYADAKVLELIEQFMSWQVYNFYHPEADQAWDTPTGYRAFAPDLEVKCVNGQTGFLPVPRDIAYRIDSPNDEVKKILDAGGDIFYSQPLIGGVGNRDFASGIQRPPNEAQRLLFGVVGYAQQNALPSLPQKGWPYRVPYPSQPHGLWVNEYKETWKACREQFLATDPEIWKVCYHDYNSGSIDWDGLSKMKDKNLEPSDPLFGGSGYIPYSGYTFTPDRDSGLCALLGFAQAGGHAPGWLGAKGYFSLALWYAVRKGLPDTFILGTATQSDIASAATNPEWVRAMRYLAHAGICLTKHYSLEGRDRVAEKVVGIYLDGQVPPQPRPQTLLKTPALPGLRLGIAIPGDDRWDPADPASVNDQAMVPWRTAVPSPFSLSALWALGLTPVTAPPASLMNWSTVSAAHPYKQATDPNYDATGARWVGHFWITHDMIVKYHEQCLSIVMRNTAEDPYDWGVLRPVNRPLFTDHPLLQWDIISDTPATGFIRGTDGDPNIPSGKVAASQWRPIAPRDITNAGTSESGAVLDWNALKGDQSHYNLAAPFSAAERTRQIVVWSADWQSYQDVETAPSAPVDASRFPRARPDVSTDCDRPGCFTSFYMGRDIENPWWPPPRHLMFIDRRMASLRNPEKNLLFMKSMDDLLTGVPIVPTGDNVFPWTVDADLYHDQGANTEYRWTKAYMRKNGFPPACPMDQGFIPKFGGEPIDVDTFHDVSIRGHDPRPTISWPDPKMIFSGRFGADRNANLTLDRGATPRSVRLHATEVGRYNFYDPRLVMSLR